MQLNTEEDYKVKSRSGDTVTDIALDAIKKGKQVIVFVNTKRSAEACAEKISEEIPNYIATSKNHDEKKQVLNVLSTPTKQCERLAKTIHNSACFHHSGLHSKQRSIVEQGFKRGKVKVIAATPTLAAGLDMPAHTVIIRDLKRYSGGWGMTPIPVLEYEQMAGRAGRPGYDDHGVAVTLAKTDEEKERIRETYIEGEPEDIHSKLAAEPKLRMHILSLISSEIIGTEDEAQSFFEETFYGSQYGNDAELKVLISKVIQSLKEWEMIQGDQEKQQSTGFVSAKELQQQKAGQLKATVLGKRVSQLYIDPLTAHILLTKTEGKDLNVFSVLHLLCSTPELKPLSRVKKGDKERVELAAATEEIYTDAPTSYEQGFKEFLNEVKTAKVLQSWINERSEKAMNEAYSVTPGEVHGKTQRAEWLLYALAELLHIQKRNSQRNSIQRIHERMKHGVRKDVLPLLKLRGIGRVRARKLMNNKIRTLKDLKKVSYQRLSGVLGAKIARSLFEQVDRNVSDKAEEENTKRKTLLDY